MALMPTIKSAETTAFTTSNIPALPRADTGPCPGGQAKTGERTGDGLDEHCSPTILPEGDVSEFIPVKQFGLIHCPAGWVGGRHPTPRRQFIAYLSGEMDFEVSDGEV